jgi:uncharacterized membrane protein YbhN (UPF0104 family)
MQIAVASAMLKLVLARCLIAGGSVSKESPENEQTHFGVVACASCLIILGLVSLYSPRRAIALAFVLVPLFVFGFLMISILSEEKRERRTRRLKKRRDLAARKQVQDVQAQLRKPDFEKRLQGFVKKKSSRNDSSEGASSRMEFWEREETYERSPTRPVELLRQLLQRIAKLVGRS